MTATFIKQPGVDVFRPEALTAKQKPTVSVLVAVSRDGGIWIDKEKVDKTAVRSRIEAIHAENPKGGMIIQADRESSYENLKAVLDAARAAGLSEVAIATEQ